MFINAGYAQRKLHTHTCANANDIVLVERETTSAVIVVK